MKQKIKELELDINATILEALLKMDSIDRKLLIITEDNKFKSLLSIGDIQRAIIKGGELNVCVSQVLRTSVKVSKEGESIESIKQNMLELRCEFIPLVNKDNELIDVYFWEDLIAEQKQIKKELNVPVVIMAGGQGTRLKPLTNIIPKPLVPIGERAIMELIINSFNSLGCMEFYCSVNYKAKMIEQYFSELDRNYTIEYFQEAFPLGTAGSLSMLKGKINSSFFVSNCDILIDQDYTEIYTFHKKHNYELTIVAALKNYKIPYGILEVSENGKLEAVKEKPDLTFFVNTGMYILEPHLLQEIPSKKYFDITDLFEKIKQRNGKIGVFPISEGAWMDIGNWDEYSKTQDIFKKKLK
ncbi:nucleotidyltransferase family protein [Aureispira sp. CCB-QB1]|uniref:nucleotidyltransferase family protein n=1 Tax=Aureispira sp. CCB-QB1 TaxID=1313421 RepID=UPI000695EC62|nr:nucleotidyltransferase family protein [Aureispira sp. CCB-QB1]